MRAAFLIFLVGGLLTACGSNSPMGKKVKEPFQGNKYESNNRFFRSVGKGVSASDNVAVNKADLEAKRQLASQVNTSIKNVSDQYLGQTTNLDGADIADKFQSLTREAMNTEISDLRKIGQEKYHNGEQYTVFVAYEIKKNSMFKFMRKRAEASASLNAETKNFMKSVLERLEEESSED